MPLLKPYVFSKCLLNCTPGEEVHGVDVDHGVLLHLEVLHLDGHLPLALGVIRAQRGPVHLRQARAPQRLLVERGEDLGGLREEMQSSREIGLN